MKANLPGVSYSIAEENITWLSIVCMNKQGFAADSLRFFPHLGPFLPPQGLSGSLSAQPSCFFEGSFCCQLPFSCHAAVYGLCFSLHEYTCRVS